MASVSYHIANLLEKMTSSDKDFRFMATNDLMAELQKDSIKLDDDSERKVVKMLLKLLEDKNGEVQNLAVKCLGPLVNKVKEFQVETIVDTLCSNMMSDKEQLRDISSIGLKTVISELPPSSTVLAASICKKITGRLTSAIAKQEDVSVQLEALDILGDLLSRFGGLLLSFHPSIQQALLPQLSSPRLAVRKRAILAISHLVMSCNNSLFVELIDFLLKALSKNASTSTTRTYIQCIGAISRQAGHRIGEHLEKIVPLIVKFCKVEDDELREYCIQAFESFVRRCPKEISPHIGTIITLCLSYICYDPNYNYDDEDDEDTMEMEADEDEEGSDDEYSDDDDMSWKVRRASAKCLDAIISTRHEMLLDLYKNVSPTLVNRFKEREENVKSDIFHAYISLLRQTRPTVSADPDAMEQGEGPVIMLQSQIPSIIKAIHKQLKEKSIKTRQCCFALLTELVQVLPGALTDHIQALVPGVIFSLGDKNSSSNMKIDTLSFLNCLMSHHIPTVFHPHVPALIKPIVAAVADPFYKITSEALLVTQQLVKVIRPLDSITNFDFTQYVWPVYQCTLGRLKAADIDQEVKERAISCMGQVICNLGDSLSAELGTCLPIFLERLKNEITRLTTVKALTMIAGSPLKIDLRPIMSEGIPILASFLRKNHRALKLCTLTCLDVMVKNYGNALTTAMIADIMKELPPLINEADLHISQLTLSLLTSVSHIHKGSMADIQSGILPQILVLVRSPLLQGVALNSLLEFFQALVNCGLAGMGFRQLLQMLTAPVYHPSSATQPANSTLAVHKQAFHSIAQCVAVLTIACKNEASTVVNQFVADIKNSSSTDSVKLFALLALGEVGRHVDLSGQGELEKVILDSFSSHNEEVKSAASYALGSVSVGNLPKYLPFVLKEIEDQPKRQYLLLHSLKEIISSESATQTSVEVLKPYIVTIWAMLFHHCECPEEGTRNVVAECLGKLTLIDPNNLLPELQKHLTSPSALTRSTVVTAVKFTISDQPQTIDSLLRGCIGEFLNTIHDPDLNVRRVALVAFNSAAHNKPSLIRDLLNTILPHLYEETKVKKELIREVEMGPFKHTVDDGLDIRKAAFECMYTLLDACMDRLDIFEFLNHVEDGLKDHYDIKMLTYLMLIRLSHLCPSAVLQRMDRLLEPLRSTCTTKVKANSVKQEFEKQEELKHSAMRAVAALLAIPDAEKSPLMNEFLSQIKSSQELQGVFESIQNTASETSLMDTS
ncbi:LOW QUALITY PROTEIN: cullin-associated NEDD8-dissociated protein 1-like [Lingula anatina]|uniref:LOW QUALITY PROTEIN: cullin-associated NEDD8-dissociated protein 1-like n=1 Tax=Lingula anatina TaxID=7574 RepID=A0A1S3IUS4_LINAN|nr:LOW QUALITY PROTEIN: cullin-associated NEDD8-dissociated protein 1-like [Lingula anatina]|eukprot:XP_013401957.1 LOW QUALITY PROTEIN: cullin-associated NEDD8-dissociated protein 1-like [Lingula anatina]